MCDYHSYRESGYTPRKPEELWGGSPMNPKNHETKKKQRDTKEMEFIEEHIR